MRILARANAHRAVLADGDQVGLEVASSPDTPSRPDRWAWSIRLLDTTPPEPSAPQPEAEDGGPQAVYVDLGRSADGGSGTLEVLVDPTVVIPEADVLHVSGIEELERDPRDLVALVIASGAADIENRHLLGRHDALVLEGEDPLRISIESSGGPADVAVVRLKSKQTATVNWVP